MTPPLCECRQLSRIDSEVTFSGGCFNASRGGHRYPARRTADGRRTVLPRHTGRPLRTNHHGLRIGASRGGSTLAPYRWRMAELAGATETLLMRYDVLETTADTFITDALREVAKADIGFSNGFRFGVPIPPAALSPRPTFGICCRWKCG